MYVRVYIYVYIIIVYIYVNVYARYLRACVRERERYVYVGMLVYECYLCIWEGQKGQISLPFALQPRLYRG